MSVLSNQHRRWNAEPNIQNSVLLRTVGFKQRTLDLTVVFHEVRVPLNTARLALANLDAEGAFGELKNDQRELIVGLDVSLRMMEKVRSNGAPGRF